MCSTWPAGSVTRSSTNSASVNGDRVAIAMRNYPEWIAAFVAITSVGAVAVPLNAWWVTDEIVFALDDSGAKVVFADDERLEPASQQAAPGDDRRHGRRRPHRRVRYPMASSVSTTCSATAPTMPEVEIDPDDDMTILYTSGTTGRPKGAVSTHRAVLSALMASPPAARWPRCASRRNPSPRRTPVPHRRSCCACRCST